MIERGLVMQRVTMTPLKKISIVGIGPTGLSALINLILQARTNSDVTFDVAVFDKRKQDDLERRQKIIVFNDEIPSGFETIQRWDTYCKKIFDPNNEWYVDDQDQLCGPDGPFTILNKKQSFIRK